MRVLLVNTLYPPQSRGGAEKSVALLAQALAANGCQVTVLASSDQPRDYVHQHGQVRVLRVRQRNLWQWPFETRTRPRKILWHLIDFYNSRMASAAIKSLSGVDFDAINTNNLTGFSPAIIGALEKNFKAPVIHTLRDYSLLCVRGTLFNKTNCPPGRCASCRMATLPKKLASLRFRGVIGISDAVLKHHREQGYISSGVPTTVIPNVFGDGNHSADVRISKPEDPPRTIGYLGRLSPEKGVAQLCDAFKRNPRLRSSVLKIAGHIDSDYGKLLARSHGAANIEFLGAVTPAEFLSTLDALVVPSLWDEPLGRVALESIAHGRPVLASRRGGLVDIIQQTGAGWLYSGDEPDLDLIKPIDVSVDLTGYSAATIARRHMEFFETARSAAA